MKSTLFSTLLLLASVSAAPSDTHKAPGHQKASSLRGSSSPLRAFQEYVKETAANNNHGGGDDDDCWSTPFNDDFQEVEDISKASMTENSLDMAQESSIIFDDDHYLYDDDEFPDEQTLVQEESSFCSRSGDSCLFFFTCCSQNCLYNRGIPVCA